jgi:hypothetical protein
LPDEVGAVEAGAKAAMGMTPHPRGGERTVQLLATVTGEVAASATERLRLPMRGLASGVYVVRVVGERFSAARRVTVVR